MCDDHEDDVDDTIATKIPDNNLFGNVVDLCEQLRPVAAATDICQSDKSSIADATNTWF